MDAVFGSAKIVNKSGEEVPLGNITGAGKVVGLYFSAHWCPPCRGFTPELVQFYDKLKNEGKGDNFEIIFVSFDRDEEGFKDYFGSMPWLAIHYDSDREGIGSKFDVRGIPAFVVLDGSNGSVITADGRSKVSNDAVNFPWK